MAMRLLSISPFFLFVGCLLCSPIQIDLGGQDQWNFYSTRLNISGKAAAVPGDIFADLQAHGHIGEPLYGQGDRLYRWVSREEWVYERSVLVPDNVYNARFVLLHIRGLDGPASIHVNDRHLTNVDNQFRSYSLDVRPLLTLGLNFLRITFQSPVEVAKIRATDYELLNLHALPPECPAPVQHGDCHVNMLRKMQASFSWDWGPSFPTVGIWRPIHLEYFDQLSVQQFSPMVQSAGDSHFLVNVSLSLICSRRSLAQIGIKLSLHELGMAKQFQLSLKAGDCPQLRVDSLLLEVPRNKVTLWWPRGYGPQPLYQLEVAIIANGQLLDSAQKRIAFRTIVHNQSPVNVSDPNKGLLFQFEVNGVPVFLKGTNWVPISVFPGRDHSKRRLFLFHSMAEANMNALRLWGGGFYEEEQFYELADQFGLLIWQDLMFACALYPTNAAFLRSVQAEVEEQVLRLRHHPSVLCWAGNNENELAIRSQWYPEWNYPETAQAHDYLTLYKTTIQPLVQQLDPSRPFLLSSPSNGAQTEKEGGISKHPGDPAFGDVHFYTETKNLWQDDTFPVPRCASEFGIQSVPLHGTMLRWLDKADWQYGSTSMVRRQHHPGGILTLPAIVFLHFPVPFGNFNETFMDRFAFLSQAHQAIALQAQIEHYRRWRSHLDEHTGLGRTMCSLYWQLNDVWAAPTWSTVDFDLRWKIAHNFVRRSFAPLIVSMYLDQAKQQQLRLFVVSDLTNTLHNVSVHLEMFVLQLGFRPIFSETIHLDKVPAQNAFEVQMPVRQSLITYTKNDFLVSATLYNQSEGHQLSPKAALLPNQLPNVGHYGEAKLTRFKRRNNRQFDLTLVANNVLPLVWLDLSDQFKQAHPEVLFHFEENAFAMTVQRQNATLKVFSNPNGVKIRQRDIQITVL